MDKVFIRDSRAESKCIDEVRELRNKLEKQLADKKADEKIIALFHNCFSSTAETTMQIAENGDTFLITGDIGAMWLRDSSAQVCHYLPYSNEYPSIKKMIRGLIVRQFSCIHEDPYANAFNPEPDGKCWAHDDTEREDPWDWERKYEIDSLCYPVWLMDRYVAETGDTSVLQNDNVRSGISDILKVFSIEMDHRSKSEYFFKRSDCPETDTLSNDGKGEPVAITGMIWGGFRPSDDACKYGYNIPENIFSLQALSIIRRLYPDIDGVREMYDSIESGIMEYGIMDDGSGHEILAYETDGMGHHLFMDDANVPSLLSIPWIYRDYEAIGSKCSSGTDIDGTDDNDINTDTYTDTHIKIKEIYSNTRKAVLSKKNPFYYEGKKASGIGSPHTPVDYIWHISLSIQGITSRDDKERKELLDILSHTDAGTGYMHEGFHKDDPDRYTRAWFAWSNSLFSLFVMDYYGLV
jgi:meiotically up-regulated gene 157 (Mug157) protein